MRKIIRIQSSRKSPRNATTQKNKTLNQPKYSFTTLSLRWNVDLFVCIQRIPRIIINIIFQKFGISYLNVIQVFNSTTTMNIK